VKDGIEIKPPGSGTLGMALVADTAGAVSLVTAGEIPLQRGRVMSAFQSYPALVVDGKVPWELQSPGRGVNLVHRDSRLAVCSLADGSLVILLTRFISLGAAGSTLPWGPTVPEMAEHMLSMGCMRAMLLDGGISSQLVVRNNDGTLRRWPNWRPVPLAMVIRKPVR
jgi:exopolysaccharide biosynthesis protein